MKCHRLNLKSYLIRRLFKELLNSQVKSVEIRQEIDDLLVRKMAGDELKEVPKIDVLNEFLSEKIAFYGEYANEVSPNEKPGTEILNDLFRQTLKEVWNY